MRARGPRNIETRICFLLAVLATLGAAVIQHGPGYLCCWIVYSAAMLAALIGQRRLRR